MGFIPEITCRHCGRKYSALHGRCPYCKSPRVKQTGRPAAAKAPASAAKTASAGTSAVNPLHSDTKWQFIFGCILIALVIIAVIVLISFSLDSAEPVETPPIPTVEVSTPPPTTPPPTPSPEPTIPVTSVGIKFLDSPIKEFTIRIGDAPIQLTADVYPVEAVTTSKLIWRSSDEGIVTVDETGAVTAVGPGWAEVIAECGGVAASCNVWVPES